MKKGKSEIIYPIRFKRDEYLRLKVFAENKDLSAAQVIRSAVRKAIRQSKEEPDNATR